MVKNAIQFLIGLLFYLITFQSFDLTAAVLGLIGFMIAYQSVYYFNDVMDYRDDMKDKFKRLTKPLCNGDMKREDAESRYYLFSIIGVAISFLVSTTFAVIVITMLLLNFVYSSNFVKLKNTVFRYPLMFLLEAMKFSIGWFAVATTFTNFPILIPISFSLGYLSAFLYYKTSFSFAKGGVRAILQNPLFRRSITIGIFGLAIYCFAFILYPFRLPMLTALIVFVMPFLLYCVKNKITKFRIVKFVGVFSALLFFILLLSLLTPWGTALNLEIASVIDPLKSILIDATRVF